MVKESSYGTLPDGREVEKFTLVGLGGIVADIITYGGIVTRLEVPSRHDSSADVVLGLPSLDAYLAGHPYFGTITGRVAGRISGGHFVIDGREVQLAINNPPNHLHGGCGGLDKKLWKPLVFRTADGDPAIRLSCLSPDGDDGYPGNLALQVTYTVTADNALVIDYEAKTDAPTPVSLTNHSYFNLAGEASGRIDDHIVQVLADSFVPADEHMTLMGRVELVDGRPNDLRKAVRVGDVLERLHECHGDNYLVRGGGRGRLVPVAHVVEPCSGRTMRVLSTEACLQFYTSAMLDEAEAIGKSGTRYDKFHGLCFECHGYPDGVNSPEIQDIILRPGETYLQRTVYQFAW